jgi:molecular chaperone GrpE
VTEQEKISNETASAAGVEKDAVESIEEGQAEKEEVDELELARGEARENYDKLLRLAAEFENYKKRIDKERVIAIKYAEENILKELLPSIDNLERAMEQGRDIDESKVILEGVELTLKGLLSTLEKFGVKPVSDIGAPFDPNCHEALAMEESADVPENHILREFQKGYIYKDRLIRAAKVVVSKGSQREAS